MKKLLEISLSKDNEVFAVCDYLELEPYAPTTARKLTFNRLNVKKKIKIQQSDKIDVLILNSRSYNHRRGHLVNFTMLLLKTPEPLEKQWWIYGLVESTHEQQYCQSEIDVFNMWQKGIPINWLSLPVNAPFKQAYLSACLRYSSLSKTIFEQDTYTIDMNAVREEADFIYWASILFFGERGYMGYCLFTFEDCLLEVFHHRGYFSDKQIIFLNTTHLYSLEVAILYETVKNILLKYKFIIHEK